MIDLAKWTRYSILVPFQGLLTDLNLCSYSVDLYTLDMMRATFIIL